MAYYQFVYHQFVDSGVRGLLWADYQFVDCGVMDYCGRITSLWTVG